MGACDIAGSGLITQELLNEIQEAHKDHYIKELGLSKQTTLVKYLTHKMYVESLADPSYSTKDLKKDFTKALNTRFDTNTKDILFLESLPANSEVHKNNIRNIEQNSKDLNVALGNIDKLIFFTKKAFKAAQNVSVTKVSTTLDEDLVTADVQASEVENERTTFSDEFSIQQNSKLKIAGKLKLFLSYVKHKKVTDKGTTKDVKTFFGTESYVEFGVVFDELQRLLAGSKATFRDMLEILESERDNVIGDSNNSKAWLDDLIPKLKDLDNLKKVKEIPDYDLVKDLFVRVMLKHKASYKKVFSAEPKPDIPESVYYLSLQDENVSSIGMRLHKEWKNTHMFSSLVHGSIYNKDKVDDLFTLLNTFKSDLKSKNKPTVQEKYDTLTKVLGDIGLSTSPEFVEALAFSKVKVHLGDESTFNLTTIVSQLQAVVNTKFRGEVIPANLNDKVIRGLASAASKFNSDDYTNMLRIGDKLVTTYPNNHNFSNRVKEIKSTDNLKDFSTDVFSRHSLYWKFINELQEKSRGKNISNQLDWFGVDYVSLTPLSKSSSKTTPNVKATKLSDLDLEILYVGAAFGTNTAYTDVIIPTSFNKQVILNTQQGSFLTPTLSDKSRAMLFRGITFRVTEIEDKMPTFKADAIDVYIDSVVMSEVDRIKQFPKQAKLEVNLDSYRADLFYFTPYLNDVFVKIGAIGPEIAAEGEEGAVPLVDVIKKTGMDVATITELIHPLVKEDLLAKTRARITEWSSLGLIDKNGFFKRHKSVRSSINPKTNANAIELALDITFSEELSMANFFQMIAGDPAQYYVAGSELITQPSDSRLDIVNTAQNITKRLASESAPGEEASIAEDPDYLQLFLNDIIETSSEFDNYVKVLDPDKYSEYKKRKSTSSDKELEAYIKAKLIAAPYYSIKTTDAQEYLTWKTQLKELKRYGEITAAEYKIAYDILKEEDGVLEGELLNKVLGPRKPVHSSTNPQTLTDGQTYHRKTYIKSSTFPLLPQFIKTTKLNSLRKLMENIEGTEGMPVRAAYKTAVKVGFPEKGIDLVDETGEWIKDIDYTVGKNILTLKSSGLRMQQDIPYDATKMDITTGSQSKKSLFANLLNESFQYNGKPISGKKLKGIFDSINFAITQEKLNSFNEEIHDEEGNLNYEYLSKLLERETIKRKSASRPILDGLKIDETTGKFTSLLGKSANVDAYMDLVNSVINNRILKNKQRGQSNTLGSGAGIVTLKEVADLSGVVYAEGYDSTYELKPMREDSETGEILPAELIVPFKFIDSKGELIDISEVMTGDVLDFTKIDPEVLEAFGFRTPTQLHPSMTYAKIVGFLPKVMGDLVIAPKEFITQMGSDFDADKLYSYLPNTEFIEGVLSVLEPITKEELQEDLKFIDTKVTNYFNKEFDSNKYNEDVRKEKRRLISLQNSLDFEVVLKGAVTEELKRDMYEDAFQKAKEVVKGINKKEFDKIRELDRTKAILKQQYGQSLDNELLKIYKTVILSPAAFSKVIRPLNDGKFEVYADDISQLKNEDVSQAPSVISHKYNKEKISDGNQAQDGISIFSSDAILQTYLEGKSVVLGEYVNKKWYALEVEFGNKYNKSSGALGLPITRKKINDPTVTASTIFAATQNITVDNANKGIMGKINMNETTAGVYAVLTMLGFEEDISTYFISQPIIVDFVKNLNNRTGLFAINKKKSLQAIEDDVVASLIGQYDNNYVHSADRLLADFKGKDAHKELRSMIEDETYLENYGTVQVSILNKFLNLKEQARSLSSVKQFLNLDSKGVKRNIYKSKEMLVKANNLPKLPIKGLGDLLGNYAGSKRFPILSEATTLAGNDIVSGVATLINTFGNEFIETNPVYKFDRIVSTIEDTINRPLGEQELHKVRHELINYLNSKFKGKSVQEIINLKEKLFNDSSTASLYGKLIDLKNTQYGAANQFLSSLDVSLDPTTKKVIINFNKVPGDSSQNDLVYDGLISMLSDTGPVPSVYNKVIPSEVAQLLVYYSLLKGGAIGQSFSKFIPPHLINNIVDDSLIGDDILNHEDFVKQYFQNNSSIVPSIAEELEMEEDNVYLNTPIGDVIPIAILYGANNDLYLNDSKKRDLYTKVDKHEVPYLSEYISHPIDFENITEFTDNSNNSVADFIANKKETTVKTLYNEFSSTNISPEKLTLMEALQEVNDVDITIVNNTKMKAMANYNYVNKRIKLNNKRLSNTNDNHIAEVLLHEHMHDRITNTLDTFLENPDVISEAEAKSIERIQEHIYNTTDLITADKDSVRSKMFKEYLWYRFSTLSPTVIDNILKYTTLPDTRLEIKEILNTVSDNVGNSETIIEKQFNGFKDLKTYLVANNGEQTLFNAMSTIYEYVAVVPSELEAFVDMNSDFNKNTYGRVISHITDLVKAMFKRLGITSDVLRASIDDIYTLARIKPNEVSEITPSVIHNGDNVRIVNNTLTYDSTGVTILPYNLELYNKLIDDFIGTFEQEAASWKNYTEGEAIAISNQSDATIVEKLSALSTLEEPLQKTDATREAIARLNNNLHAQKSTTTTENPTGEIPKTIKKIKKEGIKTKRKDARAEFFEKMKQKSTRVQSEDNTAIEDTNEFEYKSLIQEGEETMIDCGVTTRKTSTKWSTIKATPAFVAAKGAYIKNTNNVNSKSWEVVTKLQGPTHAQGGIDLTIDNGKVSYSKGGTTLKAAHGMFIAADGLTVPPEGDPKKAKLESYIKTVNTNRKGVRKNPDKTVSSHLMMDGESDGKYYAYPSLFQNEDGTWEEFPEGAWDEAVKRKETYEFDTQEEATKFAQGSWKPENLSRDYDFGVDLKKSQTITSDKTKIADPTVGIKNLQEISEDLNKLDEIDFREKHGLSKHRYKMESNPKYQQDIIKGSKELSKQSGSIDYPSTDVRRKGVINPNLEFMTGNLNNPELKQQAAEYHSSVIEAVLPIPFLEKGVKSVKSILKLNTKVTKHMGKFQHMVKNNPNLIWKMDMNNIIKPYNKKTAKFLQDEYVSNFKKYYSSKEFNHIMDTQYPDIDKKQYIDKTLKNLENPITFNKEKVPKNAVGVYKTKASSEAVYLPGHKPSFKQKLTQANTASYIPEDAGKSFVKDFSAVDHELGHQRTNASELLPDLLTNEYLKKNIKKGYISTDLNYHTTPTEFETRLRQLKEDLKINNINNYFETPVTEEHIKTLFSPEEKLKTLNNELFKTFNKTYREAKKAGKNKEILSTLTDKYFKDVGKLTVDKFDVSPDTKDLQDHFSPAFLAKMSKLIPMTIPAIIANEANKKK